MRFQDHMIEATRAAANETFRYAKAVPADKLEWTPLDEGRSVIDICRELAMCPTWAAELLSGKEEPEWNEEAMAAMKAEQAQWKTADDCEAECSRRLESLYKLFAEIDDERLKETKWLPYDGGRDFTVAEMMGYPLWNFVYHEGQIAYVQTLFGDKEMH